MRNTCAKIDSKTRPLFTSRPIKSFYHSFLFIIIDISNDIAFNAIDFVFIPSNHIIQAPIWAVILRTGFLLKGAI